MPQPTQPLVAILYEHPLLGEGIAQILRAETQAEVALAPAADTHSVHALLARHPHIVIFEGHRSETTCHRLAPHALLIDVTSAMATPTPTRTTTTDPARLILAVQASHPPATDINPTTTPTRPR